LYLKYRFTILTRLGFPSSAPIERLFSFGEIIHNAVQNPLLGKSFETLMLLKVST